MKKILFMFLLLAFGYSQCDSTNVLDYYPNMQGCELAGFNFMACTEDEWGYINCGHNGAYGHLLGYADFTNANLEGATLSLDNDYYSPGYIDGTIFTGANLKDANFTDAYLYNVDFTGANLESADFTKTSIYYSTFNGANMKEAVLEEMNAFSGCSFIGANLEESRIAFDTSSNENLNFTEANFSGAYIGPDPSYYMAYVSNGNFTDANFTGADISRMEFYSNCTHYQANFHGANLLTVAFQSSVYKGNFSNATLHDVRFNGGSDITEANFQNANIDCTGGYSFCYGCDASGANFKSVTFGHMDISNADLNNAIFSNAIFLNTFSLGYSDIQDTCFDEDAESIISFYENTGTPNFGVCEFEYDDGCAYEDEDDDGNDDSSFAAGESSVIPEDGIGQSDVDAAYAAGYAAGESSVIPEDGIGQSDVDAAYEAGVASVNIGDANGDGIMNIIDLVIFVEILLANEQP